jgi:uncharacterized protein YkwD
VGGYNSLFMSCPDEEEGARMPKSRRWATRLACAGAVAASLLASVASAAPSDGVLAEQAQVVALVNEQRSAVGLPPLVVNDTLTDEAQQYADYMADANFFSHYGPDGSNVQSRAEAAGYTTWTFLGENLAAGQDTPDRVVKAWMNSPTHRDNILSPDAAEVGVGHVYASGTRYGNYWALELGKRW